MTIQQRIILFFSLVIVLLITVVLLMWYRLHLQEQLTRAQENRYESYRLAVHLKSTADQLSRMARTFTVTADPRYREYYTHILAIRNGKEAKPSDYDILFWDRITFDNEFKPVIDGEKISFPQLLERSKVRPEEMAILHQAKKYADQLTEMERDAFNLMRLASIDDSLSNVNRLTAQQLLHGVQYHRLKAMMMQQLSEFFSKIDHRTAARVEEILQRSRSVDHTLVLLILLLLAVALYSWFHSRRRIVHPLRELIQWTERLKEGKFSLGGTIRGQDEIAQLARSFTTMAETIHQSFNDLNIQARTDRLTGLPNRLFLELEMERMHMAIKYYDIQCTIILLDLDHFKEINDRYGHDVGDQVLIFFSQLLSQTIQTPHVVGRWGGEEFIALTKNLTLHEAELLAERLRTTVTKTLFPRGIRMTVSAGLAPLDARRQIRESLVRADEALYRAKAAGRNRTESESGAEP